MAWLFETCSEYAKGLEIKEIKVAETAPFKGK